MFKLLPYLQFFSHKIYFIVENKYCGNKYSVFSGDLKEYPYQAIQHNIPVFKFLLVWSTIASQS